MMQEHRRCRCDDLLVLLSARSALHTLLVQTVRDAAESARATPNVSAPLFKALRWMEAHLGEPFLIDDAAAVAGLSIAAFHDHFQREIGRTPAEWRTQKRIERAKDVPHSRDRKKRHRDRSDARFGSSQYFATAFKRYTAHTPTEYRQGHQSRAGV
jgi:AraC-like DNA-binding protein